MQRGNLSAFVNSGRFRTGRGPVNIGGTQDNRKRIRKSTKVSLGSVAVLLLVGSASAAYLTLPNPTPALASGDYMYMGKVPDSGPLHYGVLLIRWTEQNGQGSGAMEEITRPGAGSSGLFAGMDQPEEDSIPVTVHDQKGQLEMTGDGGEPFTTPVAITGDMLTTSLPYGTAGTTSVTLHQGTISGWDQMVTAFLSDNSAPKVGLYPLQARPT